MFIAFTTKPFREAGQPCYHPPAVILDGIATVAIGVDAGRSETLFFSTLSAEDKATLEECGFIFTGEKVEAIAGQIVRRWREA